MNVANRLIPALGTLVAGTAVLLVVLHERSPSKQDANEASIAPASVRPAAASLPSILEHEIDPDAPPKHAVLRLGTTRWVPRHGMMHGLAWSPDGTRLATWSSPTFGSSRNELAVWEHATGKNVVPAALRPKRTTAAAWSSDGRRVVVSCDARANRWRVLICDADDGTTIRDLGEFDTYCDALDWSADGRWIVGGRSKGATTVWDARTGEVHATIDMPAFAARFSPDSKLLAIGWDKLVLRDVASGKELRRIHDLRSNEPESAGFTNTVWSLAFFRQSRRLAIAASGQALVWEYDEEARPVPMKECNVGPSSITVSADDRLVAAAGFAPRVQVWDAATGEIQAQFEALTGGYSTAFSPDGKSLVLPGTRLSLVNVSQMEIRDPLDGHFGNLIRTLVTPDGRHAISGGVGRNVCVWNLDTGDLVRTIARRTGSTQAIDLARDGKTLIVAGTGSGIIEMRELETGDLIGELDTECESLQSVACSPVADLLITVGYLPRAPDAEATSRRPMKKPADDDDEIELPDITNSLQVWNLKDRRLLSKSQWEASPGFSHLTFAPDGMHFALSHGAPAALEIHSASRLSEGALPRGVPLQRATTTSFAMPVAFAPDGSRLAAELLGGGLLLMVRELGSRRAPGPTLEQPDELQFIDLAWSPDDRLIAAATIKPDGNGDLRHDIRVWSAKSGKIVQEMSGHWDMIRDLAFTPDGKRLLSASQDSTLLLWDLAPALAKLAVEHRPAVAP
ncbi:MAG: WD40 repeat domain-containing protein [Planctomycetales bacterium]